MMWEEKAPLEKNKIPGNQKEISNFNDVNFLIILRVQNSMLAPSSIPSLSERPG